MRPRSFPVYFLVILCFRSPDGQAVNSLLRRHRWNPPAPTIGRTPKRQLAQLSGPEWGRRMLSQPHHGAALWGIAVQFSL